MRWLLRSTRVRCEPRSRSATVLMPIELMELPEGDSAEIEGRFCRTSSTRTRPVFWMSSAVTLEMGLIETSFGACIRRDPVMTTSSTGAGVAGAVCAYASGPAAVVAAAAREKRTAFRTFKLGFLIRRTPESVNTYYSHPQERC